MSSFPTTYWAKTVRPGVLLRVTPVRILNVSSASLVDPNSDDIVLKVTTKSGTSYVLAHLGRRRPMIELTLFFAPNEEVVFSVTAAKASKAAHLSAVNIQGNQSWTVPAPVHLLTWELPNDEPSFEDRVYVSEDAEHDEGEDAGHQQTKAGGKQRANDIASKPVEPARESATTTTATTSTLSTGKGTILGKPAEAKTSEDAKQAPSKPSAAAASSQQPEKPAAPAAASISKSVDTNSVDAKAPVPERRRALKVALKKPLVKKLPSGVTVEDHVLGDGPAAFVGKLVKVNVVGKVKAGPVFEESHEKTFRLGIGQVVRGLDYGIVSMRVGGQRTIRVPKELGYTDHREASIRDADELVFDVQLIQVT